MIPESRALDQGSPVTSFAMHKCKVNKVSRNEMDNSAGGKLGEGITGRYCCPIANCIGRFSLMADLKKHYENDHVSKEFTENVHMNPEQLSVKPSDQKFDQLSGLMFVDNVPKESVSVAGIQNSDTLPSQGFDYGFPSENQRENRETFDGAGLFEMTVNDSESQLTESKKVIEIEGGSQDSPVSEEGVLDLSLKSLSCGKEGCNDPGVKLSGVDRRNIERVDVTEIINDLARRFEIDVSDLDEKLKSIPVEIVKHSLKKEESQPGELRACPEIFDLPTAFFPSDMAPTSYTDLLEEFAARYYDTGDRLCLPFQSYQAVEKSPKDRIRAAHLHSRNSSVEGAKKRLTAKQKCELKRLITSNSVQSLKLRGAQWSKTNVAELVRKTFQVACSEDYANHLVYSQGMSFKGLNKPPKL
ncbi:hypothetical protein GV64_04390 [Endozoicomonas elysicola]|uniref:C2H2-type domain-containing protein n=2 Tax=Endozoicomonas elysicola TaxID=305900 RepID=A0A081K7F9_9GAMM|nr:hypothetical protein GV64_04390 [Endozoicomonas elysicola]